MTRLDCPHCGSQQAEERLNATAIFNCGSCSQAIHPPNCSCWQCLEKPRFERPDGHANNCPCHACEMAELEADMMLGIKGLRVIKKVKREDEAARLDENLDPQTSRPSVTIVTGPSVGMTVIRGTRKICARCGTGNSLDAAFCGECGQRYP